MTRASLILDEFFQQFYRHRKERRSGPYGAHYGFRTPEGHRYRVHISHDVYNPSEAEVSFAFIDPKVHSWPRYGVLGGRPDALKIFSTVHHIMQRHMKDNPGLKTLHFTAYGQSRVKLYRRLLNHFSTKHGERGDDSSMHFSVNREDIKEPIS